MRKAMKIVNIDCANCAAKIEDGISKLPGVKRASVNFITGRFLLEADEERFDEIIAEAQEICKKVCRKSEIYV